MYVQIRTKYWPRFNRGFLAQLVRTRTYLVDQYVLVRILLPSNIRTYLVWTYHKYVQIHTICTMVYVSCTYNTYLYVQYRISPYQYVFVVFCTYIRTWIRTDTLFQESRIFCSANGWPTEGLPAGGGARWGERCWEVRPWTDWRHLQQRLSGMSASTKPNDKQATHRGGWQANAQRESSVTSARVLRQAQSTSEARWEP